MRVLVTGKEGQLVRSLLERAEGAGIELVPKGRPEADLETPGAMASLIGAGGWDAVVNAAAYTAVDQAEDEPDRAMRVNADAAGEIAAAARAAGIPVIQISTDYVFDGNAAAPYAEDAPTAPLGVYGRTKLAGEEQVRRENAHHLILRTAWLYSPYGRNFLTTMMGLPARVPTARVVADQVGNPSSALDLADGVLTILSRWRTADRTGMGQTYHLAGSGEASWADFARHIFDECRALGLPSSAVEPIPTSQWPTRARRPANSRLDCAKFARDFGFLMPAWRASAKQTIGRLAASGVA